MPTSLKNLPVEFKDPLLDTYHATDGPCPPEEMEGRKRRRLPRSRSSRPA